MPPKDLASFCYTYPQKTVNYTKRENSRNAIPLFMLRTVKLFLVVFLDLDQ